jgi:ethanolamine utilization protein EutA
VHFTPLLGKDLVDGPGLKKLVAGEYEKAGITPESVDTGAIIITGETSRKENAASVLKELEGFAGEFVVATAGPDLESVLAARGAGAVEYSRATGKTVLHMDIGGGTSNLALIQNGEIRQTGCLNVGGRLVKFDRDRCLTWISPVLRGLRNFREGQKITPEELEQTAALLVSVLEMAAGLLPRTELMDRLTTEGTSVPEVPEGTVISFSGGVADCIETELPGLAYGDMGPSLGKAIRKSLLCRGSTGWGSRPSGLPSSGPGATAPSCQAVRCFTGMSGFL